MTFTKNVIYIVLVLCLSIFISCESDYDNMSIRKLTRLAEKNDSEAQLRLGIIYFEGEGVEKDYDESFKYYSMAAKWDHPEAQSALGMMFFNGFGVKQDDCKALEWFTKAARKSEEKALAWFHENAEKGDIEVQYILGDIYYKGTGLKQDYNEAQKWFNMAAEKKHSEAQLALGNMHFNGEGFPRNVSEAIKWYRASANENNAEALFKLGKMYFFGDSVKKNYNEAIKLLKKSADIGHYEARQLLNRTGIWTLGNYVDEFGDRTGEKFLTNSSLIRGTFSNTATTNSSLNVKLLIENPSSISLELYEYARNTPVRYPSRSDWFVTARDNEGKRLVMIAHLGERSGRLRIVSTFTKSQYSSVNASSKDLHNALLKGGKLDFYIEIEDSATRYRFTIDNADYYDNAYRMLRESS